MPCFPSPKKQNFSKNYPKSARLSYSRKRARFKTLKSLLSPVQREHSGWVVHNKPPQKTLRIFFKGTKILHIPENAAKGTACPIKISHAVFICSGRTRRVQSRRIRVESTGKLSFTSCRDIRLHNREVEEPGRPRSRGKPCSKTVFLAGRNFVVYPLLFSPAA